MNKANLIPGAHKLTDEDRQKGKEARRVNSSFRKMAKKLRGTAWTNEDDVRILEAFGIPEQEQTLGMMIVVRTAVKAAAGDKDARRDFLRMTGDDPDVAAKEKELDLKKEQASQKNGTDTEQQEPAIRARAELRAKVDAEIRKAHGDHQ